MTEQEGEPSEDSKPVINVAEYLKAIEELTKSDMENLPYVGKAKNHMIFVLQLQES